MAFVSRLAEAFHRANVRSALQIPPLVTMAGEELLSHSHNVRS